MTDRLRAIAQQIRELPRYKVSELDGMLLPNPQPDGDWVPWSRIKSALDAALTPQEPPVMQTLPYERIDSKTLVAAIRLQPGEQLLVLQPFGWHIDGHHTPNAAEQFSREGVCEDHGWRVVCDYGPYVAVVAALIPRPQPQQEKP